MLVPFVLPPGAARSAVIDGGVAYRHDVMVSCDPASVPAERWLAVCLCESGTTPQPTREAAIADGRRHLLDHGSDPWLVEVFEPSD